MNIADRLRAAVWRVPVGLQLSALYTLLLVAILALLGGGLYTLLDQFLVQNTETRLGLAATTVLSRPTTFDRGDRRDPSHRYDNPSIPSQTYTPPPYPLSPYPTKPFSTLNLLVRDLSAPDVTVAVLDSEGTFITSTMAFNSESARDLPSLPTGWLTQVDAASSNEGPSRTSRWIVPATGGGRQLVVAQSISAFSYTNATTSPTTQRLVLVQAASLDAADATLNLVRLYLGLGLLIGTVVGVLAGLALTRAVLQPLDRMARTAEAIAGGDLNRRLHLPPGRNEVARLGGAFDHMVDRLAATLAVQRRFIADASHELRTPLTSLEGLNEMLLIGADRGDSRTIQRMARAMHGELGRMGRMVSDLLTLSRLDSAAPLAVASVEVGALLDEVAEQMAPLADARAIGLEVAHDAPIYVLAEPDRLKQVLLNLVDNALRYTPPDGAVRLSVVWDPSGSAARIQVMDTGPGIAPDDLPYIFDRFYRGDPSRARANGNTGLGLAIARGIVEAHGGTIVAQSLPGAGACFIILLPAEPPIESPVVTGAAKRERQAVRPQV